MMKHEMIQVRKSGKTAVLTVNNPPANALKPELRDAFRAKLNEISGDDDVWSLIVTGAGERFFMAGADIPGLLNLDAQGALNRVRKTRELFSTLAAFQKPSIAAINGICMGGGLELALVCDIRIAADHVKLGLPEVNLGLIPGAGGTQRLPRMIGPGWANYLMFTGEPIGTQKALEIGLIQESVPAADLLTKAMELAEKINGKGPLAVRAAKRASSTGLQVPLEKGLDLENQIFSEICDTQDKVEGITAFLEKRRPRFQAR
jgi:enoyl-CoA hydratase